MSCRERPRPDRISRRWVDALVAASLLCVQAVGPLRAGGPPPGAFPASLLGKEPEVKPASLPSPKEKGKLGGPEILWSSTEVRTETPAVAGAKLALEAGQGSPEGTRFRWMQIEGPPVEIADPDRNSLVITIPPGTDRLGFLLVAAHRDSVRVVRVLVPVQGDSSKPSWGARPSGKVRADAGDDQIGLVGHRVTLNGSRSRPNDAKSLRWLQTEGPGVASPQQLGSFLSFVPTAPGLYKFLLIAAGDGEVAEPDEVAVLVGAPPNVPTARSAAPDTNQPAAATPTPTPDQILGAALPRLPNSARVCSDVADVMDSISQRATLYESFAMLQTELTRRLDVVIPPDPEFRAAWTQLVFSPLTAYTAAELLPSGLDFRSPQTLGQPLSPAQQVRVREHFQGMARAFRVVAAAR